MSAEARSSSGAGWRAAGAGLQAGGALVQGIGGLQAGKANARLARAEAKAALREGVARDDEIRRAARRAAGEAIAAMGANGVDLGTGSALDALREIEVESGLDRLRAKAEAQGRASALRYQAKVYKRQGAFQLLGGLLGASSAAAGAAGGGGG